MWIISLVVLVALGVLGIAAMLRARSPELEGPLKQLEAVEGWIGVVGLVLGVLGLLQWLSAAGVMAVAPITMLLSLASTLAMLSLSLIFAIGLLGKMLGESDFSKKLIELAARLVPFKAILGFVCLGFAAYVLLRMVI